DGGGSARKRKAWGRGVGGRKAGGGDIGRPGAPLCGWGEPLLTAAPAGNVPPMGHRAPTAKASLRSRDVTWTPQPADIRDGAARRMHFWLGRASEGRLRFQRRERKIR